MITDKNGKPIDSDSPSNGKKEEQKAVDVRTVPTGTLMYNLCLIASREDGAYAMLQQLEAQKVAQKSVTSSPDLLMMHEHYQALQHTRYGIAAELNFRFRDADLMHAEKLGVEMYEPGALANDPSESH